jgi:hypothetical protein
MTLKEMLGLDTRADRYTYGVDPVAGYVSSQKIPDRWVSTTCGYCSVGCGMFIGVKDGRAVSVRGNPDTRQSRMLCPKGLSEHHTINADNRARYPLLRRGGSMQRVTWDDAMMTMAARFRDVQARYGPGAVGRDQHRTARHRRVLRHGQADTAWPRHAELRRQHDAVHVDGGAGLQAFLRQRRAARARTRIWKRRTSCCSLAPTSPRTIRSCAGVSAPTRTRR